VERNDGRMNDSGMGGEHNMLLPRKKFKKENG